MSETFGIGIEDLQQSLGNARYFYGLRRTDQGTLYMVKADLLELEDGVIVNQKGAPSQNYNDFTRGQDFFEGKDTEHKKVFDNLVYEQFRWDGRNLFYYINEQGELVLKVNESHTYEE